MELEALRDLQAGGSNEANTVAEALSTINPQTGITILNRISQSPYASRLSQRLSQAIQASCQRIIQGLSNGRDVMRAGNRPSNPLGQGFFELRASDAARVIVRRVGQYGYEVVGQFQAHAVGAKRNSDIIEMLIKEFLTRKGGFRQ